MKRQALLGESKIFSMKTMSKKTFSVISILFFLAGSLFAQTSYRWDLVNALARNDLQRIETILKDNISTMTATDKRLVMNFTLTYSYGDNAIIVFGMLQRYNIRPDSFDLYTAINRNQPNNVIGLLLQNGATPNGEILLLAMEKQRFDAAITFIEMGADVNYHYPLTSAYADGMTPLIYASKWNNFELVRILLERGAFVNARTTDGNTALSISYANQNTQIYSYLTEHGAVEAPNNPVQPAQSAGISTLLDNQATVFQRGTYRLTGGTMSIRFAGNTITGTINYTINSRVNSGIYTIMGNNLTIVMEGRTFTYKIDSNTSFSGNGEAWTRTGD
jgi:hypothetical protein